MRSSYFFCKECCCAKAKGKTNTASLTAFRFLFKAFYSVKPFARFIISYCNGEIQEGAELYKFIPTLNIFSLRMNGFILCTLKHSNIAPAHGAQQQCITKDVKPSGSSKSFFGVFPKSAGKIKSVMFFPPQPL